VLNVSVNSLLELPDSSDPSLDVYRGVEYGMGPGSIGMVREVKRLKDES
jgi:hypothetical protein